MDSHKEREGKPELPHIVDTTHLRWNPSSWQGQYFFRFDNHMAVGIEIPLVDNFTRKYSKMYLISTFNLDKAINEVRFIEDRDSVVSLTRSQRDEISCTSKGKEKDQFIQYLRIIKQHKEELKKRQEPDKAYIYRWENVKKDIPDIVERYYFIDFNWDSIINKLSTARRLPMS